MLWRRDRVADVQIFPLFKDSKKAASLERSPNETLSGKRAPSKLNDEFE